jgi:EAL domain-containing protein (putative c-di-GMP-specific phosphodiesterase class I)
VRFARELGIEVIAEGVETDAQARFLVAAECHHAQGYFFSKPLSADATTFFCGKATSTSFRT